MRGARTCGAPGAEPLRFLPLSLSAIRPIDVTSYLRTRGWRDERKIRVVGELRKDGRSSVLRGARDIEALLDDIDGVDH